MRHIATIHTKVNVSLCCKKHFNSRADLRLHQKTEHKNGYFCHTCDKNFDRKALLERHEFTHTVEKPFKCDFCLYTCSNKYNLERHGRLKHTKDVGDNAVTPLQAATPTLPEPILKNEGGAHQPTTRSHTPQEQLLGFKHEEYQQHDADEEYQHETLHQPITRNNTPQEYQQDAVHQPVTRNNTPQEYQQDAVHQPVTPNHTPQEYQQDTVHQPVTPNHTPQEEYQQDPEQHPFLRNQTPQRSQHPFRHEGYQQDPEQHPLPSHQTPLVVQQPFNYEGNLQDPIHQIPSQALQRSATPAEDPDPNLHLQEVALDLSNRVTTRGEFSLIFLFSVLIYLHVIIFR